MKRIILGLSLLLMLVQNGFAKSDAEYDKMIANEPDKVWKQIYRCNKESLNHEFDGDVNVCLKAIELLKNNGWKEKDYQIMFLNSGILYVSSEKNYIKAYKYFLKAAKLGNTIAQGNLDILCKYHSWVCKQ